jgi:8-oxo-dGTP diphosphatase
MRESENACEQLEMEVAKINQLRKPFVLSVRMLIHDENGRCLLLKRSVNNKSNVGKWEFPGGKIDPGEKIEDAMLREVAEETGLKVRLERVAGSAESEMPAVRVAYLIFEGTKEVGQVRLSNEHDDYVWVTPQELLRYDLIEQFRPFADSYARTHANQEKRIERS